MSNEPLSVTLTWAEVLQAVVCGASRNIKSVKDGRSDLRRGRVNRTQAEMWGCHIEGAAGEMAFAKAIGRYWGSSIDTFKAPDVASVQVRTRSSHSYDLIVRNADANNQAFVLLTGASPTFVIRGWMLGADAKVTEFLQDYDGIEPAYFVPQAKLRSITDLFAEMETASIANLTT